MAGHHPLATYLTLRMRICQAIFSAFGRQTPASNHPHPWQSKVSACSGIWDLPREGIKITIDLLTLVVSIGIMIIPGISVTLINMSPVIYSSSLSITMSMLTVLRGQYMGYAARTK
jgi:hypothetical protein